MKIIFSIIADFKRFFNIKTKRGKLRLLALALLLVVVWQIVVRLNTEVVEEVVDLPQVVTVSTASQLSNGDGYSLVGTVEAKDQARIQTEAGGRVTSVSVELGQSLSAGQVIAQLENAAQYASLLQAEGSYEAAKAAAAQSEVSVADAENALTAANNNARNTYRNSFTAANNAMLTTVDQFYSDTQNSTFGVKIVANGQAASLTAARKQLTADLSVWQTNISTLNISSDASVLLDEAESVVNKVLSQVDAFIELTSTADLDDELNGQSVRSYTASLISLRTTLNGTINSIDSARTSINSAEEAVRRAQIGSTQSADVSAANAQIKQALGALRAAEAAYNKTIIRTPIAGTLNELSLKAGDYVGIGAPVALVANNNALEITTYVGERDVERIAIGQTVMIEGNIEGVISAIAPGVDQTTKKTEVKIGTESDQLKTGDTVTVSFTEDDSIAEISSEVRLPLTAVKFTASNGSIFVVEDNHLVAKPVELGTISGSYVVITEGMNNTTEFVVDARGLTEGSEVEVTRN